MAGLGYQPKQLIVKHSKSCACLNGLNPGSPWCLPKQVTDGHGETHVGRDLSGRRNPNARHTWLLFRCNDCDCPAKLAVYWPLVEGSLQLFLPMFREADHG